MATTAISAFKAGNTALITGGASGIGLALAKKCHSHGMRVAIVDNNVANLDLAKKAVGEHISTFAMDVAKLDEWGKLKETVLRDFGKIDLLALNAGIGAKGSWPDTSYFERIMSVNLFGIINGLSTFVPTIQSSATASNPATIVITGSKQGITNPPGNPAYNASKAAVKSLAEHLSFDLRHEPIAVHLLVPGWTYTGLSGAKPGSVEGKPAGAWSAEQVVDYLEGKMAEGSFWAICPDNDVTEDLDRRRMLWAMGDAVESRPPLSRWREDWKDKAVEGIKDMKFPVGSA